jgi:dTDP-4-amino-4,6-dideoxygalactose transaminase
MEKIDILISTDIIFDALIAQAEDVPASAEILKLCSENKIKGWITADDYIKIFSCIKENNQLSNNLIEKHLSCLSIIPIRSQTISDAHELNDKDFSDNIKIAAAQSMNIKYFITLKMMNCSRSSVKVMLPADFLKVFNNHNIMFISEKIAFVNLKVQFHQIYNQIDDQINKVINETSFIQGKYVKAFEKNFAKFCKAKHCIGVGNGTDALFIALKALNISRGDEVLLPANSFIATSEAVTMAGASVVFVDCDPETYNIDLNRIRSKITNKTKAIIPVHLYGQPAHMSLISEIAKEYNLNIVQDCAQAHGATFDNKPLADFGDILCFSFYPGKNLGAYGNAGAIVTNDNEIANKVLMFSNHGRKDKYKHEFEGINSRLDDIQGAVLNIKLNYLNQWNDSRRNASILYNTLLEDIELITTPYTLPNVKHVYHLYVIRLKKRNELQAYLSQNNILTGIHYPIALPNLEAYSYLNHKPADFPVASQYQNEILSLPVYPGIAESTVRHVSQIINNFMKKL